jgi:hypothetical protein
MTFSYIRQLISVGALTAGLIATPVLAQTNGACADTTTTQARGYRNYYGVVVSRTDTAAIRVRNQIGLPSLSNSQVRLVGDTAVCRIASQAYDATLEVPYPTQPVIVLELGTKRVVVKDIGFRGGVMMNLLFDQAYGTLLHRMWR